MASHRDQEIHLSGRGLLLVPSYFCVNGPMTMFDPELTPVLIYPVGRQPDTLPFQRDARPEALGALIGDTRAVVLEVIGGEPRTTSNWPGSPASRRDRRANTPACCGTRG